MKNSKITVIKLGGNIIDDPDKLNAFLVSLAELKGKVILVHGGGKVATSYSKSFGIEAKMIDGRRVTDEKTIDIVTMVYAGLLNKQIVAKLQSFGANAIGLSGVDGSLIKSVMRVKVPVDYGFVGDPLETGINASLLLDLLEKNYVPVIAPITHDGKGNLLNTNADTIASTVAIALSAFGQTELIYCFEKDGVLSRDEKVIHKLDPDLIAQLVSSGTIHSGMIPKLNACMNAHLKGVTAVKIGNAASLAELVNGNSLCTTFS